MRKSFLAAAGLCAFAVLDTACAQSTPAAHRRYDVPLPANVMTSDDWLDPGNVVREGSEDNYARMVEAPVDIQVGPVLDQNY